MWVPAWGANVSHGQPDGINHYKGDVQAIVDYGFDGIKLDNCGVYHNMSLFAELINNTGRRVLIEECHWGGEYRVHNLSFITFITFISFSSREVEKTRVLFN